MSYDLKYNSDFRIIEIVLAGLLSAKDVRKCTEEALVLQKELGVYACLIDAIDLVSISSITDLYDLPDQYQDGGLSRLIRIAWVSPKLPAAREAMQFYDNVCNNRGWTVQPFETRDEAVEWLPS